MLTRSESRAFRNFDRQEPREPVEFEPWEPMPSPRATPAQLHDFIERLADHGIVEDNLGELHSYRNTVFQALAIDWLDDRRKLPGHTYVAFERWATAMCNEMLRGA